MPLARGESAAAGIARALRDPGVAYAEANFRFTLAQTPYEALYPRLWAMPKIGAPAAWERRPARRRPTPRSASSTPGSTGRTRTSAAASWRKTRTSTATGA
jgi:hypothetical protein